MLENHVGNVQLMQRLNRLKVLNIVRKHTTIQRADIARLSGLSLSSVTNIVNYLMSLGLILDSARETEIHVGRKAAILEFNYAAYKFVCCAVTKSEIITVLCGLDGRIFDKCQADIPDGNEIEDVICRQTMEIINRNGRDRVLAVGIAISAMVTDGGNTVFSSSLGCSLHGFYDRIIAKVQLPVIVENLSITNAVYYADKKRFIDKKNLLFIDFIGGIGAVQLFCGEVNRAFAGEIGHTTIDPHSDEMCVCGNRGCLERLCSVERLMRLSGAHTIDDLVEKYKTGFKPAVDAVKECMEYLGISVANLVDTLGPDRIILNGADIFDSHEIYELFISNVKNRAYGKLVEKTSFTLTHIENVEVICGMALHLCDVVFDISFDKGIIE
ncbi:MAG: ROK family transcriptional regulator [Ruminococcaceae bacterium]|nr:ROK family transcriptional regulator [Oscillospiraceae bacterium]